MTLADLTLQAGRRTPDATAPAARQAVDACGRAPKLQSALLMRRWGRRVGVSLAVVTGAIALSLAIAQDQDTIRLRSAVAASSPESPEYLGALAAAAVSRGNSYRVLNNGDEIFPAMLQAIDGARERVRFETFVFESGEVAERFVDAFVRAASRGVNVNIIVDFVGGSDMSADHMKRLRAAGCRVSSYNKAAWYQLEEVNYRTHRKILVVDGDVAFTGGVGIADHWLGHAQDPKHWRDTQVEMRGPVARLLEAAFYDNFIEVDVPVMPALDEASAARQASGEGTPDAGAPVSGASGPAASLVVRSSATGGSSDLKRLYLMLIASARKSVDIASPYFVSDESSEWALADAVRRGVKVRVLTEGEHTDAWPVKYSSRRSYDRLLSKGITLAEYGPTMLHTKLMVVDGAWSVFGSANFDNRSLELNDELNVAVHDSDLAGRFAAVFEDDLRRSRRLDIQSWRERPLSERAREFFWGYWGEIF